MTLLHFPKINTNGLLLAVDVASSRSYPGTGTTWADMSGNDYSGTLTNGPTFTTSSLGSMNFDGVNDFCNFGNVLDFTTNDFSVEAWFKRTGNSTSNSFGGAVIAKGSYSTDDGWSIFVNNSNYGIGEIGFQIRDNNVPISAATSFAAQNNVWYHAVGVRNTTDKKIYLYINGVLQDSPSENPTVTVTATNALYIGTVAGWARHFYGNIPIARVYNRALSAAEVLQNFNVSRTRFGM